MNPHDLGALVYAVFFRRVYVCILLCALAGCPWAGNSCIPLACGLVLEGGLSVECTPRGKYVGDVVRLAISC